MEKQPRRCLYLLLLLIVLRSLPAFAQSGVIQGTLVDSQGGVIANAKVAAYDEVKALIVRETVSGGDGSFQLRPLLRGTYTVKAESAGFKILERKGLVLDPFQIMNLGNLTLEIGEVTDTISVEAEIPLVETTTSQKSFVISSRQVTELSLNGRDFQSLIRTLPGVVSNDTSDFRLAFNNTDSFNVNGLRGSHNNFFLDGTINTDVGANDGQFTQLSMDAVGEFKVHNSVFNAEYGRNPGILLSATTKSGGSEYHGTLYEFLRNDALDARFPFDTTGRKSVLRFNQFGGNVGGPIWKEKKLFFFYNFEGTRASRPRGGTFTDLPHPDLLNGDFRRMLRGVPISTAPQFDVGTVFMPGTITRNDAGNITGGVPFPDNVIPRAMWSRNAPAFVKVLAAFPRAGAPEVAGQPWLVRVPFQDTFRFRKNQNALRIDWNASEKTSIFFRWVDDSQRESQQVGIFASTPFPIFPQFRKKPGSSWSWNFVKVISPSTTNEFIFSYNHLTQLVDVLEDTDKSQYDRDALGFQYQQLYPNSNLRNRFPRFNCGNSGAGGISGCNFPGFAAGWLSEARQFAWTDNFTKIRGSHTFKTGTFFNMNNNGQQPAWNDVGFFDFLPSRENALDTSNGLANLLLGNYVEHQQSNGRFYGSFRFFGLEFYGQDSWKVNRHLTLEYGARYVFLGPTFTRGEFLQYYFDPERYDPSKAVRIDIQPGLKQRSIIPGSGDPFNGMIQEGQGIPKGFSKHRKNQVSPRFGFAYDPFGDGKTSIRGGFGTFFERIRQNQLNFDGLANPPLTSTPRVFVGNVDNVSPALIAGGTLFPANITAWNKEGFIPTIYSWSFGIQREFGKSMSLDVAYVGNTARHLQDRRNINQLPLGTTTNTSILRDANNVGDAIRPFKGYSNVLFTDFAANSNYHAMQLRLSRRFAKNLTFNTSYTWSKVMAQTQTDGEVIGYHLDRRREWGLANWDRTQILTIDYVYELPNVGSKYLNNPFGRKLLDGWQVSGITRLWDGFPLTVGSNGDPGTLGGGVRADYIGGSAIPSTRTQREYFNPLVFARPLNGQLGNTGKGILRGPGINNWDISLFKNTQITERVKVQFRFETFNIFNHTQWAGINTGISVPNPGQAVTAATRGATGEVTSTRDPRNIQLGLKIYF